MEQLTLIQIYEDGQVNVIAEININEKFSGIVNKEIIRRHLTKIIGMILGKKINVYYRLMQKENEQQPNTSEPTAVSPAKEDGSISDAKEDPN